jgi:hypothetical protein
MSDVLTIREAVQCSKDEGVPVSEYALRRWVKTGAILTRQAGTKTLIYFPRLVEFLTCADGCDNAPATLGETPGIRRVGGRW